MVKGHDQGTVLHPSPQSILLCKSDMGVPMRRFDVGIDKDALASQLSWASKGLDVLLPVFEEHLKHLDRKPVVKVFDDYCLLTVVYIPDAVDRSDVGVEDSTQGVLMRVVRFASSGSAPEYYDVGDWGVELLDEHNLVDGPQVLEVEGRPSASYFVVAGTFTDSLEDLVVGARLLRHVFVLGGGLYFRVLINFY